MGDTEQGGDIELGLAEAWDAHLLGDVDRGRYAAFAAGYRAGIEAGGILPAVARYFETWDWRIHPVAVAAVARYTAWRNREKKTT